MQARLGAASTLALFFGSGPLRKGMFSHDQRVSHANIREYTYAAPMLFIAANAFAKASVIFFITAITPQRGIHRACWVLLATVIAWAVSGVFAIAFQCQLPTPWSSENGKCINQWALYLFLGLLNISTDLALIVIPVVMMWWVQTKSARRLQVMALFASRILCVRPPSQYYQKLTYFKQGSHFHNTSTGVAQELFGL